MLFDTLLIDGTDIVTWATVDDGSGILRQGGPSGDLIEFDFTDGAVWEPGPRRVYSFDVPVTMAATGIGAYDEAMEQLRALQAFQGVEVTLTRRVTVNGVQVSETCQAVLASAVEPTFPASARHKVQALLTFQNLSGRWT